MWEWLHDVLNAVIWGAFFLAIFLNLLGSILDWLDGHD